VTNEGDLWFTKRKDEDTLYAIVKTRERWPYGTWRELVIKSARASRDTEVSVLGQSDQVLEYQPNVFPKTTWKQQPDGLHVRAMRAQRLQNNRRWPNPVVLKLTHVKPALAPPRVITGTASRGPGGEVTLSATLESLGDAAAVEVGFEHRSLRGFDVNEQAGEWTATPLERRTAPGSFTATVSGWTPGEPHEFRALVRHPVLTLFGEGKRVTPR
jgi:alpha-L-fucosidase